MIILGWNAFGPDDKFPSIHAWATAYLAVKDKAITEERSDNPQEPTGARTINVALNLARLETGIEDLQCQLLYRKGGASQQVLWVWDDEWNERHKPSDESLKVAAQEMLLGDPVYFDGIGVTVTAPCE